MTEKILKKSEDTDGLRTAGGFTFTFLVEDKVEFDDHVSSDLTQTVWSESLFRARLFI